MKKIALAFVLSLLAIGQAFAVTARSGYDETYGTTWSIDSNGVLTVSGSMASRYKKDKNENINAPLPPWYNYSSDITSVVVSEGVTSIGDRAFRGLSKVTSVSLPSSLQSIGQTAFENNTSLQSVTIPSNVSTISEWAFKGNTQLASVTFESGVTTINKEAFYGATSLTALTIANTVTTIGQSAFENATSIQTLTIPNSVTSMGEGAFKGLSSLTDLTIGSGLTTIAVHAFENATSLETLVLPSTVKKIEEGAFSRAESLKNIDFGGVEEIGNKSFAYNFSLEKLVIPDTVKKIGDGTFVNATSLKELVIGDGVTSIGKEAFSINNSMHNTSYVSVLEKLTIGKNVTSIGDNCFKDAPLTEITIDADGSEANYRAIAEFLKNRNANIKVNCLGGDSCSTKMAEAMANISGLSNDQKMKISSMLANGKSVPRQVETAENSVLDRSHEARVDKRIYTVQEANAVAGNKNRVMIRYR